MTTSNIPWSTRSLPDLVGAEVLDAQGNAIATFKDYRDAELVVAQINAGVDLDEVEELKGVNSDYERQISDLEEIRDALQNKLNDINAILDKE